MRQLFMIRRLWIVLLIFVGAGLACNLPQGGQTAPTERVPIPVTTESIKELQEEIQSAAESAQSNTKVEITVTEEQLTSLAALELASQTDPAIRNPQVYLRDGQIELNGDVEQSGMNLPLEVILTVSVDANGQLDYQVQSAQIGPLPLPDEIVAQIETQIDRAFAAELETQTAGIFIESITIAEGRMTITGFRR